MAKNKNIAGAEKVFELLNTHHFGVAYSNRCIMIIRPRARFVRPIIIFKAMSILLPSL